MDTAFVATGGARVGCTNATWPFAKLTATTDSLRVSVGFIGDYDFTPNNVVAITRYSLIPILGWGIQIQHCVPEYPSRMIFWCLGNPDTLLAGIRKSGFSPQALASNIVPRKGFALRWQAIAAAIAAWNGLIILVMTSLSHNRNPALLAPLLAFVLGIVFAATFAVIRLPALQNFSLKPGRNIGEIRPFLNLLKLITGIMFVVFSLVAILQLTITT